MGAEARLKALEASLGRAHLCIVVSCTTEPGNVDQGKTFEAALDRAFDLVEIRQRLEEDGIQGYIPMIRTHRAGNVLDSEHFTISCKSDSGC